NVEIRGVGIDGGDKGNSGGGVGISILDHSLGDGGPSGPWREYFLIENMHIRNVQAESNYIGPNWFQVEGNLNRRMRYVTMRDTYVHDGDGRCMSAKSFADPDGPAIIYNIRC